MKRLTNRKLANARVLARRAVHVSFDGMAGRSVGWVPQWVVWLGAGEDAICVHSGPSKEMARIVANGVVNVVAQLMGGATPRKHDYVSWLDDKAWADVRRANKAAVTR